MFYKGYEGSHEYDPDEGMYIGSLKGIEHFVQYKGETQEELEKDFKSQVNSYINYFVEAETE